jgi:hypothetical protein
VSRHGRGGEQGGDEEASSEVKDGISLDVTIFATASCARGARNGEVSRKR